MMDAILLLMSLWALKSCFAHFDRPVATSKLSRGVNTLRRRLEDLSVNIDSGREHGQRGSNVPVGYLMGSFYAYLWVGTPPQRVSVIVDTGSHHTAFPCVGCRCGKRMDPYFDPKRSSTSKVLRCGLSQTQKCMIKQSYSEGSSWHAYQVTDKVFMGTDSLGSSLTQEGTRTLIGESNMTVDFTFGCQDSETGLFLSQKVDGIMGLSGHSETLPHVLHKQGKSKTKIFGLCFKTEGGVLQLGGIDTNLHKVEEKTLTGKPPQPSIDFVSLLKPNGWFTVRLVDILMQSAAGTVGMGRSVTLSSLGVPMNKLNAGRGTIIDSGTTDTYLPKDCATKFNALFRKLSGGIAYNNRQRDLSSAEFASLPSIVFRLERMAGSKGKGAFVDIVVPPSSYTEIIPNADTNNRAFRIYTTESAGTVLGANFMVGYNVIFDIDRKRVGFAKSDCEYGGSSVSEGISGLTSVDSKFGGTRGSSHGVEVGFESMNSGTGEHLYMRGDVNAYEAMEKEIQRRDKRLCKASSLPFSTTASRIMETIRAELGTYSLVQSCDALCVDGPTSESNSINSNTLSLARPGGVQVWERVSQCPDNANATVKQWQTEIIKESCQSILCAKERRPQLDDARCLATSWSDCDSFCKQYKTVCLPPSTQTFLAHLGHWFTGRSSAPDKERLGSLTSSESIAVLKSRQCEAQKCPVLSGDQAITVHIRINSKLLSSFDFLNSQQVTGETVVASSVTHETSPYFVDVKSAPGLRRDELVFGIAKTLRVSPTSVSVLVLAFNKNTDSNVDKGKVEEDYESFVATIKIRISSKKYGAQTIELTEKLVGIIKSPYFVHVLAQNINLFDPLADAYDTLLSLSANKEATGAKLAYRLRKGHSYVTYPRWCAVYGRSEGSNAIKLVDVSFRELSPRETIDNVENAATEKQYAKQLVNMGNMGIGSDIARQKTRSNYKVDIMAPLTTGVDYSVYHYPSDWEWSTWMKFLFVVAIQGCGLLLFLVFRKWQRIRNSQEKQEQEAAVLGYDPQLYPRKYAQATFAAALSPGLKGQTFRRKGGEQR